MLELLNNSFSYLYRTTYQNDGGQCPIVLRIIFRGERRGIFTGLYFFKENWDKKNCKVKKEESKAASLNQNLDHIVRKANHSFDELKFIGNGITINELVDKVKVKETKPTLLIDFLQEGNQKMKKRVGTDILKVTYMKYKRSLQYMKDFLEAEFKVKNFRLDF
jgi:hypothetical protein